MGIAEDGNLAAPTVKWGPAQLFTSHLGWQEECGLIKKIRDLQGKGHFGGRFPREAGLALRRFFSKQAEVSYLQFG